ncbi:MAG TPA: type VI secretion system baseplate subunit TssF [Pseudomonas sp.]|nr:type VI secretion system baseplate subunit TssF [Pseudomonas sp.]
MSFNHYYQSELSALRQLGKRFAERNPALAPFLGQSGRDPDVERLLEGFAFLGGRLRQKLDDELPELTHSLLQLLWPHCLRPLPAFTMLQFDPLERPASQTVAAGTPVEARPLHGVTCRFRTTAAIEVLPLALTHLDYAVQGQGARLSLRLELTAGHLGEWPLERLRLHLSGEPYVSQQLYLSLLRQLGGLDVLLLDEQGQPLQDAQGHPLPSVRLDSDAVQPAGFAEDEALVPYPLNSFRGYRLLQEFFAFPDKFLFVDLGGLERLTRLPEETRRRIRGLLLRLDLHKAGAQRIRPTLDNVRLYCTPVVNLFAHDAMPIRLDGRQDRYLLRPADYAPHQCGVFAVERVIGWKPGGMGYEDYVPFESFEHDPSFDSPAARPWYSVRQQPSPVGDGLETWLSFSPRRLDRHETLSVELTCTNQDLPRELAPGDICLPSEGTPQFLAFRNIGAVTPAYAPPLQGDYLWKLVSNLSLNYLSLADVRALRVILETYDLPRHHDQHAARVSQRRLEGLRHIRHQQVDRLLRGLPVRGVRTELTLDAEGFLGEGELFLFASVLNEFFALYASLNSYHELRVQSTQGEVYQWTPRMGQQPLL